MPNQNQGQNSPAAPKPAKIKATYRLTISREYLYSLTARFIEFYFLKNKTNTAVKNFINSFFVKGILYRSLPILDIPFYINALNPNTLPSVIANQLPPEAVQSFSSHQKDMLSYFNELLAIAVHSPAPAEMMTVSDFANRLGLSIPTINTIVEEKKIPYYTPSLKKRMISVSDYNVFLASIKNNSMSIGAAIDNPEAGRNYSAGRRHDNQYGQKNAPSKNPKSHEKDKSKNNGFQKQSAPHGKKPDGKPFSRDVKQEEKRPVTPLRIESADSYSSDFGATLKKKLEVQEETLPTIEPINTIPEEGVVEEPVSSMGGGEEVKAFDKQSKVVEQPETAKSSDDVKQPDDNKQPEVAKTTDVSKDAAEPVVEQPEVVDNGSDGSTGESMPDDEKITVSEQVVSDNPASVLDTAPVPSPAEVKITEVIKDDESQINTPEPELPEIPQIVEENNILPTININPDNMALALQADDNNPDDSPNIAENISPQNEQPSIPQYHGMSSEDILKAQQKLSSLGGDNKTDGYNSETQMGDKENKQRKRVLIKTK